MFYAAGYVGSAPFYAAAEVSAGPARGLLTAGGVAMEIITEGAHVTAATGNLASAAPGIVVGVVVAAATSSPVGIAAAVVVDGFVSKFMDLYEAFKNLEDPDGGYNGANLMGPGYNGYGQTLPPDVLEQVLQDCGTVRRRMIWNKRPDFGAEHSGSSGSGYAA